MVVMLSLGEQELWFHTVPVEASLEKEEPPSGKFLHSILVVTVHDESGKLTYENVFMLLSYFISSREQGIFSS